MSGNDMLEYRKKYLTFRVTELRRETKAKCIEYKGGKCEKCGYDRCPGVLQFHHLVPGEKDFGIAHSGHSRSFEKCKPELDKCIMVCANCHGEIHAEEHKETRSSRLEEFKLLTRPERQPTTSVLKPCSNCQKEIKVYKSYDTRYNYCNRACRDSHLNNLGWPSKEELRTMRKEMSVKDIALKINKSQRAIYSRLSK
jgi:hypothetical protein